MAHSTESSSSPVGSCRGCGYALRGLASNRCPECGRPFDPADPKTMNMGRRPGAFARWLARPLGWMVLAAMFLATAAVAYATRPQLGDWRQWDLAAVDLPIYLDVRATMARTNLLTPIDAAYVAGLWLWFVVLAWCLGKVVLGWIVRRRYQLPAPQPRRRAAAFVVAAAMLVFAGACVMVGWPFRVGQHAAEVRASIPTSELVERSSFYIRGAPWEQQLIALGKTRARAVLMSALIQSPAPRQRLGALWIIANLEPTAIPTAIERAVAAEQDPDVRGWQLRLLGLTRDPLAIRLVSEALASNDPGLRVAATEAIVAAMENDFSHTQFGLATPVTKSDPPLPLDGNSGLNVARSRQHHDARVGVGTSFPEGLPSEAWDRIRTMMLSASSVAERDAAAQALQTKPPRSYRLRAAEWGVWASSNGPAALTAAREALDDIPQFVHRFADPAALLEDEYEARNPEVILKPVLHLTADTPMPVSLVVSIRRGRVFLAYPRPDDYHIDRIGFYGIQTEFEKGWFSLSDLDRGGGPGFADRREPFEWLKTIDQTTVPGMSARRGRAGGPSSKSRAIGLDWRTLVVVPDRRWWMHLPALPADPKYAWWARLRDVPCSWVTNRGESERFVYYDGPTLTPQPVRVALAADGKHLSIESTIASGKVPAGEEDGPDTTAVHVLSGLDQTARKGRRGERRAMLISVSRNKVSAEIVPVPSGAKPPPVPSFALGTGDTITGASAESTLRDWIIDAGLTDPEADGMIACWRETFFQKPGRRFILLMSAADYDSLCPIQITPVPTEMARVGLVWTELP